MKTTADNREVPERCYYYLLDWKDSGGWEYMQNRFRKQGIAELTYQEFWNLFAYVTHQDQR